MILAYGTCTGEFSNGAACWRHQCLVSAQPPRLLKAWGKLGELLVFSPHCKDEEAGF